jgi:hypothetical protein
MERLKFELSKKDIELEGRKKLEGRAVSEFDPLATGITATRGGSSVVQPATRQQAQSQSQSQSISRMTPRETLIPQRPEE